jgi:hypothetical protein
MSFNIVDFPFFAYSWIHCNNTREESAQQVNLPKLFLLRCTGTVDLSLRTWVQKATNYDTMAIFKDPHEGKM